MALSEFARNGYSGARVDEIAARTRTTKRMIYYYFTSKEQLYIEVLEHAYRSIRSAEQQIDVEGLARGLQQAAALPCPNGAAREATAVHDVRRQAERIEEILSRAVAAARDQRS